MALSAVTAVSAQTPARAMLRCPAAGGRDWRARAALAGGAGSPAKTRRGSGWDSAAPRGRFVESLPTAGLALGAWSTGLGPARRPRGTEARVRPCSPFLSCALMA